MSASPRVQPRAGTLAQTVRAVLWGFLGVRRKTDYEQDIARLHPLSLMAVGVVMAFLFVGGLIGLVHWIAG